MKEIKVQAHSSYVLGKYRHQTDEKNVSNFTKEQIMVALGKSKEYSYTDWFGSTYNVTFTITNIEEGKYGYIYTIHCNENVPNRFFPSVYDICDGYANIAAPISTSIVD